MSREPWLPSHEPLGTYAYLCCNCGAINRYAEWTFLKYVDNADGSDLVLVPVEDGDYDPICVCPSCNWHHSDDDSGPGVYDGSLAELAYERERLLGDPVFAELWAANRQEQPE